MSRKPVIITAVIVACSMLFAMVFMSMSEEDINTAMSAFRTSTQETPPVKTETIINQIEKDKNGTHLGDLESGDPGIYSPGLGTNIVVPEDLKELIMMDFDSVYPLIVGTTDPAYSFDNLAIWNTSTEAALINVKNQMSSSFQVDVWKWASSDPNDLTKVASKQTIECNNTIRPLVEAAFRDIFNSPEQPVIVLAGGYSIRRMNNGNANSGTSGHAFGCVIDINWESQLNGCGNKLSSTNRSPSYDTWKALPECQTKYEIFYDGCTVVNIFKSYGFYWGGNWNSYTDGMHFGFLGDNGHNARKKGQEAYMSVQGGN